MALQNARKVNKSQEKIKEHSIHRLLSIFKDPGALSGVLPEISTPVRATIQPKSVLQQVLLEPYDFSADAILALEHTPAKTKKGGTLQKLDVISGDTPHKNDELAIYANARVSRNNESETHFTQKQVLLLESQSLKLNNSGSNSSKTAKISKNVLAAKRSTVPELPCNSSGATKRTKSKPVGRPKTVSKPKAETAKQSTDLSVSTLPDSPSNNNSSANYFPKIASKSVTTPIDSIPLESKRKNKTKTSVKSPSRSMNATLKKAPKRKPGRPQLQDLDDTYVHSHLVTPVLDKDSRRKSTPPSKVKQPSKRTPPVKSKSLRKKPEANQKADSKKICAELYARLLRRCVLGDDSLNILGWRSRLVEKNSTFPSTSAKKNHLQRGTYL